MSKHDVLTEAEFSEYTPYERTLNFLEDHCKKLAVKKSEMNILDWGCGRGRTVLWLRERGYNAFGVDIDPEPIQNGMHLFSKRGYDDSLLSLLDGDGRTKFPDDSLHFVFSNQVFEHVSDLELVARELRRITVKNGVGYHVCPAHRAVLEGHLFMPFIHWLPKSQIRKYLILVWVCLGREPRWKELRDSSITRKTEVYFNYSVNKTYYRKYSDVRRIFEENGFRVDFETINHPKVKDHKLVHKLASFNLSRRIVNHFLLTLKSVELVTRKL